MKSSTATQNYTRENQYLTIPHLLPKHRIVPQLARRIERMLAAADVQLNGDNPWDMQVLCDELYPRVAAQGSLGLGEAYVEGWWECDALDEFFHRVVRAGLEGRLGHHPVAETVVRCMARVANPQSLARSRDVAEQHYDIGNDLYNAMLDRRMIYSCAYWKGVETLDEAQEAKLDLICRKLDLHPGMRVLDVGCGWGGLAQYMAEHFGISVVGITISTEQAGLAAKRCRDLPVEIRLEDYRKTQGLFDRIVSVGMFEHVGRRNYATFMMHMARLLKSEGLMLLHTIGRNDSVGPGMMDPWIAKYIFPHGELPSMAQIAEASEPWFVVETWQNLGPHYDPTLVAWHENFERAWSTLERTYGAGFRRMWRYYLLCCAGAFRARKLQVWQYLFSRHGVPGGLAAPML